MNVTVAGPAWQLMRENMLQIQCSAVETFHRGKGSTTVQRQTRNEQYYCLSQGQAKCPAQLVAMQRKHMVKVNNKIAIAKARRSARPSLWQCKGNTW